MTLPFASALEKEGSESDLFLKNVLDYLTRKI
jgi:hypothetical protein